jgi:fermentation-respiration switch protein FrsA (DUF1100 family)
MPTLLVFHGNGSSAATRSDGWGRFWTGLRNRCGRVSRYSANPGRPSEVGLAADADAFTLSQKPTPARRSFGWSAIASAAGCVGLARRQKLDAVLTVGTFTRLRAMAPKLARAFVPDGYDNKAAVAQLDEPYFLVHGSNDSTVPLAEGEQLHKAAGAAHKWGASSL